MARIPSAIADPPRRTNVGVHLPRFAVPDGAAGARSRLLWLDCHHTMVAGGL